MSIITKISEMIYENHVKILDICDSRKDYSVACYLSSNDLFYPCFNFIFLRGLLASCKTIKNTKTDCPTLKFCITVIKMAYII